MKLQAIPWDPGNSFAKGYYEQESFATSRFDSAPWNEKDWEMKLEELERKRTWMVDRGQLADVLLKFNRAHGASDATLKHIESLRNPSSFVIAGGQQAGLFTGPLLVIYKAITIIQEARYASQKLQREVVPIFWIAGEDHDFEEVNHMFYVHKAQEIRKTQVEKRTSEMAPISLTKISSEQWAKALQEVDEAWVDTEFKSELFERLHTYASNSDTLTGLFARIMHDLFADYGLVLLDSQDAALRQLEIPFFKWLIDHRDELEESFKQGESKLRKEGYALQAPSEEGQAYVFKLHEGRRTMLYKTDEGFGDRQNRFFIHHTDLITELNEHPEHFSNNVLSRPLMMQFVLPVLGTVLGTSEMAYWGQLKEAFQLAGFVMPLVIPRYQYTIIEGAVARHLRKFELSPEQVLTPAQWEEKRAEWIKSRQTVEVDLLFHEAKEQFLEIYEPIVSSISDVQPGLRKLAQSNQAKIVEQMNFLHKKTNEAFLSQHDTGLRQWDRIRMSILPEDKQQERVFNIFSYLVKYGSDWLDELIKTPIEDARHHHIINIAT